MKVKVTIMQSFLRRRTSLWANGEVSVGHMPLRSLAGEQDFPFLVRDVRLFSRPSFLKHEGVRHMDWEPGHVEFP